MGAGGKLMPLTQQPSFEAVKTLDVRPSTRAGNSKTTSYIPRRVLYTEPYVFVCVRVRKDGWELVPPAQTVPMRSDTSV